LEIVRLEGALKMPEVLLDALSKEEEHGLGGMGRELGKEKGLFVDLVLEESKTAVLGSNSRSGEA
jgi:hypothetical protein